MALGATDGVVEINVAQSSATSSLLPPSTILLDTFPGCHPTPGSEAVELHRLDDQVNLDGHNVLLQTDVQGAEREVLNGAPATLGTAVPLLSWNSRLSRSTTVSRFITEMLSFMADSGYELVALDPGFRSPVDGTHLSFDGVFHRHSARQPSPQSRLPD